MFQLLAIDQKQNHNNIGSLELIENENWDS